MIVKELDKKAPRDLESDSDEMLEKVQVIRDSIYIVSKLDFMKNRECNPVFIQELWDISFKAHRIDSENLSDRIRNLIKEKVPKDYDKTLIAYIYEFNEKVVPQFNSNL